MDKVPEIPTIAKVLLAMLVAYGCWLGFLAYKHAGDRQRHPSEWKGVPSGPAPTRDERRSNR
jgi:hypothetical protein